jgi:hypothetical protein
MIEILLHGGPAVIDGHSIAEADKGGSQTSVDLDRACAELPDFIKCQRQIILPRRQREGHPDLARRVAGITGVELPSPKPSQQILDLIERPRARVRI